tara:strand:+ start:3014 stop:3247 length:234 start_codon:yes stop_codon:yes gene_type:complete
MRFKIPGRNTNVRLFEKVETTDPQYLIFDVGVEYEDGSIDSLVVPGSGSYATARRVIKDLDAKAAERKEAETAPIAA